MRISILAIFITASCNLLAQRKWSFETKIDFNTYSSYKGTINGKYPITMYLEESYETCTEDYRRSTPRKVYGWYMYDKVGVKIPLVGHVCYADICDNVLELFAPEDPVDYAFDENCKIIGAKEVFRQNADSHLFEWQMKNGEKYPVELTPVHKSSFVTNANLLLKINNIEIESFNINKLAENDWIDSMEILASKRVNDKFHLIFKFSHQSNPGSFGFGMCGAGTEDFVAHMVVNNEFKAESFSKIQVASCVNSFDDVEVAYDPEHPELGIAVKK